MTNSINEITTLLCYLTQVTIEKGKTLGIKTLAMAEDLTPNGEREVFFEMNGQLRSVFIKDKEAVKVCSKQGQLMLL